MPLWLSELFCPEHGLAPLVQVVYTYWGLWRVSMRVHVEQKRQYVIGFFRGH